MTKELWNNLITQYQQLEKMEELAKDNYTWSIVHSKKVKIKLIFQGNFHRPIDKCTKI